VKSSMEALRDELVDLLVTEYTGELSAYIAGPATACVIQVDRDEPVTLNLSKIHATRAGATVPAGRDPVQLSIAASARTTTTLPSGVALATVLRARLAEACESEFFVTALHGSDASPDPWDGKSFGNHKILEQAATLTNWGLLPETLLTAHESDCPAGSFFCVLNGQPALRVFTDAIPQKWETLATGNNRPVRMSDPRDAALRQLRSKMPPRHKQLLACYWANINLLLLSLDRDEPVSVCLDKPAPFVQRTVIANQEYDYWLKFSALAG